MKKERNEKRRKKTVIIVSILVLCFVAAGIFAGLTLTKDTDAKELQANEIEIINEDGEKEVVEKDSKEAKEYKEAVKASEREEVTSSQKNENKNNSSSSNKNNSSTSNKNSSSSSNSGNSSSKEPAEHVHCWELKIEYYEEPIYGARCNGCGYETTDAKAMAAHKKQGAIDGTSCRSHTGYVAGTNRVETSRYYECTECDAVK